MVIFPSLIQSLDGTYAIKIYDNCMAQSHNGVLNSSSSDRPLIAAGGGQKIKISFMIPLSLQENKKLASSPYIPVNSTK